MVTPGWNRRKTRKWPASRRSIRARIFRENEAAELFGVKIGRIKPDYQDRLYRIDQTAPFKDKE